VADDVPKEDHLKVFGRLLSLGNMGFIVGPLVGGYIADSSHGYQTSVFLGGCVFILNAGKIFMVPTQTGTLVWLSGAKPPAT
jgi:MFS family permease